VNTARLPVSLRAALRFSQLALHLSWGVALAGLAFPLIKPARRDRIITAWARRLLKVLGVQIKADAAPRLPGGALLVCNHVSWLDIYLIYAAQRVHFVSKSEVRAWPVAGWLAHKTGTLFLERSRRAATGPMPGVSVMRSHHAYSSRATASSGKASLPFLHAAGRPRAGCNGSRPAVRSARTGRRPAKRKRRARGAARSPGCERIQGFATSSPTAIGCEARITSP
jgi:1-acyl-sn-glycerol-3-phosphate acyltransferase